MNIFRKYTLKSLQNQSNRNFTLWLSFRPQEKDNPITEKLRQILDQSKIPFVITFEGLMYYDDKFSSSKIIINILRVLRDFYRKKIFNIYSLKELWYNKNRTLLDRLARSLSSFEFIKNDWIYVTRIDSDDMFGDWMINDIQQVKPFEGAISYKNGYIFDKTSQKLADWNPTTNPPFHTIIFKRDTFLSPRKHLKYFGKFRSHEDIPKVFDTKWSEKRFYCVLAHDMKNQISTIWNHPFKGREYAQEEKEEILKQFGIVH